MYKVKASFIFLIIGCSSSQFSKTNKHNYVFSIENWKVQKEGTQTFRYLSTTLQNHSKDTLNFAYHTCSRSNLYVTDNPEVIIKQQECENSEDDQIWLESLPPKKKQSKDFRGF